MVAGVLTRAVGIVHAGQRIRALEFPPAVVASVILAFGMALLGAWVGNRMEEGVLQREASETVLAMDSFIKPLVQDLAQGAILPDAAVNALTAVMKEKALGADVAAIKIWLPDGTIVYSNRPDQIGRTYPLFDNLRQAFNGQVVAQFDDLSDEENEYERSLGLELLEIYAPVRESGTNRIIAVAEFYEIHENLRVATVGHTAADLCRGRVVGAGNDCLRVMGHEQAEAPIARKAGCGIVATAGSQ